jgi:hypothetical protein
MHLHQQRPGAVACAIVVAVIVGTAAARAGGPVTAAVLRSQGTGFRSGMWPQLNAGWSDFGTTQVEIDYQSLAISDFTFDDIAATDADVLIISLGHEYTDSEAQAITDYVTAGHGLIVTYSTFRNIDNATLRNSDLMHLVGLQDTLKLGTSFLPVPIEYNFLATNHPLFAGLGSTYETGVPFMMFPSSPSHWDLTTGTLLAHAAPEYTDSFGNQVIGNGAIIANENQAFRSVYFSHYIEDTTAGTNQQDLQVFYNTILWTGSVPEPGTLMLIGCGFGGLRVIHGHGALARRVRCTA